MFDAVISAAALKNASAKDEALRREIRKGAAANPFLYKFYPLAEESETPVVPGEHIGVIYSSFRASLAIGDAARLSIVGDEEEQNSPASGDIAFIPRGEDRAVSFPFNTGQVGPICLGVHVNGVNLEVPQARVEIGPGTEAELVAPVSIHSAELSIAAERVSIEGSRIQEQSAVSLKTDNYSGTVSDVPAVRGNVTVRVLWPGNSSFPWTRFEAPKMPSDTLLEGEDEALRRLARFVVEFHSLGSVGLACPSNKIDSTRMTKGPGQAVLDHMVAEKVLRRGYVGNRAHYFLDTNKLFELTGATYVDFTVGHFEDKAVAFVRQALEKAK